MTTEIILRELTPTLNSRLHWTKKRKLLKRYHLLVMEQTRHRHAGPVRLEFYRLSRADSMDYDNLVSASKLPVDALKLAGVIPDDNPAVLVEKHYEHIGVKRLEQQMTVIKIIDL